MTKNLRLAALTLLSSLVAASCGGGSDTAAVPAPPPPPAARDYVIHTVRPQDVDSHVTAGSDNDVHIVIPPLQGTTPTNKLFVFLPGTGGVPNMYELILEAGSKRGFHTFGLDYPNTRPVGGICAPGAGIDSSCFFNVRKAIIQGGDANVPDFAVVTDADAIVTRLQEGIAYLDHNFPTEGWAQYLLSDGTPNLVKDRHQWTFSGRRARGG